MVIRELVRRMFNGRAGPLRNQPNVISMLEIQHDEKLFASVAPHEIFRPCVRAQALGNRTYDGIASRMPMRIVNPLKVVDVNKQYAHSFHMGAVEALTEVGIEGAPVVEPGERITFCSTAQGLSGRLKSQNRRCHRFLGLLEDQRHFLIVYLQLKQWSHLRNCFHDARTQGPNIDLPFAE